MSTAEPRLLREVRYPALGVRPVEILQSRLCQDENTMQILLYLTLRSVSARVITGVYLDLCCFDSQFQLLATQRAYPLTGLKIQAGAEFGGDLAIPVASFRTASVTVTLNRVTFADGSQWLRAEDDPPAEAAWEPAPPPSDLPRSRRAQRAAEAALWKDKTPLSPQARRRLNRRRGLTATAAVMAAALVLGGGLGAFRYVRTGRRALADADALYTAGQYEQAAAALERLERRWLPEGDRQALLRCRALARVHTGDYAGAFRDLGALDGKLDSGVYLRQLTAALGGTVAAGDRHSVGLCRDGSARAAGDNSLGQCNVGEWRDLVAVAAGANHTLGLRADGTVEAVGLDANSQCALGQWREVIGIAAGERHSVGVMKNGRVVAAGDNSQGQCDTGAWSGMAAVAAGRQHTVGLRLDGTVEAVGDNSLGACDVEDWRDIIAIAAGNGFTAGVRRDGTVVVTGDNTYQEQDTGAMTDTVGIAAGDFHLLALEARGRLAAAGDNDWRQCEVALWKELLAAAGGQHHSVGICKDGTACAAGDNKSGQCGVADWADMGLPEAALAATAFSGE